MVRRKLKVGGGCTSTGVYMTESIQFVTSNNVNLVKSGY